MPNFDGGHYFLTTLIPISTTTVIVAGNRRESPIQLIRKSLATLPTALQTVATEESCLNSPFSRNNRTHFARFVVIEDVMYNGRDPQDAIKNALTGDNPVIPQPQDSLSSPYLLFVADFDAKSGEPSELNSYLVELWKTMEAELRDVFQYCVGFDQVVDGTGFANYLRRGQIETTMPFNDYWTDAPPLKSLLPKLIALAAGFVIAGIVVGSLVAGLWGAAIGFLLGAVVALIVDYQMVMKLGAMPLPTAPNTTLPSVLKALYLQQHFTNLAIDVQGADDATLYAKFAEYLKAHQPNESTPAQTPGVIKS